MDLVIVVYHVKEHLTASYTDRQKGNAFKKLLVQYS